MSKKLESLEEVFSFLEAAAPSATGTWNNVPGASIGLTMSLIQSGNSVTGSGQVWDPSTPGKKTPFSVPSGTNNYPNVNLAIDITGSSGSYVGTFQSANQVNGTVTIAGYAIPLNVVRAG